MAFALTVGTVTFLMAIIWGSPLVELMRRLKLGKNIRIDGPQSHMTKMGTPAMGGVLIIGWVVIISIMVNIVQLITNLEIAESVIIPLAVMVAYSILGGIDDYMGFRTRPGIGMFARQKFYIQSVIAIFAAFIIFWFVNDRVGLMAIPTVPVLLNIGWLYLPIAAFIITATSNAVNLTDGLDGLAGLTTSSSFIAYGIIAFLQDQQFLVIFCFTVVGACFAFLWYNAKPAQMFMGDVGSQALGGALAVVALMTNQWLILPIIAIIPVATTVSNILQVSYFKMTGGKRLFRMAPLHHHFELIGWSETQIVQRWWLISILSAMAGIALALI
ncbi:MAG: phospho-N-acetylmuramoyl-pentapeptide-transferase [Ardenticatenaceae bacterium]|nr:phospho-N-acetylmuramoyl-pentapeptide-transferase [Ardenticatenaceae bacterium]